MSEEIIHPRFFRYFEDKVIKDMLGDELHDKYFEYYKPFVTDDDDKHAIELAGHPIIRQINIDDPNFLVSYIGEDGTVKRVPVTLVPTVEKMVPVDPFERRGAQMKVDSDYKFKAEDGTIFDSIEAMIEHFKAQRGGARRKTRRNKRRISRRHRNAKRSGR